MAEYKQQLTVIMFSEITGYDKLLSENDHHALAIKKKTHDILKKWLGAYGGMWQGEYDQGVVTTFPSVSKAVYCAGAIQLEVKKHRTLNLQIGIHLGELIEEKDAVRGDGVAIVSAIAKLIPSGRIYVSEQVSLTVLNEKNIQSKIIFEEKAMPVEGSLNIYDLQVDFPEVERMAQKNEDLERKGVVFEEKRNILTQRLFVIITGSAMVILLILFMLWLMGWVNN